MLNQLKEKNLIPYSELLISLYKKMKINEIELSIILIVFMLEKEGVQHITPNHIINYSQLSFKQVDQVVMQLVSKGLLVVSVSGMSSLPLKNKMLASQIEAAEVEKDLVVETYEREFGKTFSIIELEMIESWRLSGIEDDIILWALKEAVIASAINLRYIDKVLFEWKKNKRKKEISLPDNERWWEV